ncbi:UDP-glucuronate 4-epimerase [Duganella sp. 1411]|uniref:NAD-dependent epimerase/dehydratase family protein n=1 Tax=Duganella sp. 1411 TaxID=2806572 RepID=UPI001AE6220A|nr:NAD-dependent epimerase/dehydratase family protein [Duganella sp. 1411]MBP1205618.1 UDP-glucuronate 4-epimerase [Duganella sp. 1411]
MSSILVTGAAGFIGAHLAARLARMGHTVVGVDNFNDYYAVGLKHGRVESILRPAGVVCHAFDLCDEQALQELFAVTQPDYVLHLAAQAGVRYSVENPKSYLQSNLLAFGNILEASRQHRVKHLVFASSSSVYGSSDKTPFQEDDPTDQPISLYASTKKANEVMAYSYSAIHQLPITGLRLFSVYGPWGRPDMAYFNFTKKILLREPLEVFSNGTLLRDFTYIDDVSEAVTRLLFKEQAAVGKVPYEVFNIGNRRPTSVLDFIRILENLLGVKAILEFLPMQLGDVRITHAGTDKLHKWIDFSPDTQLQTGLSDFVTWYREWHMHDGAHA